MGVEFEIESLVQKFMSGHFGHAFSIWKACFQKPPVAAEDIIDIAYQIILIAVLLVIEGVPAIIIAELFVYPPS